MTTFASYECKGSSRHNARQNRLVSRSEGNSAVFLALISQIDCRPQKPWRERLLQPSRRPDSRLPATRTCYKEDRALPVHAYATHGLTSGNLFHAVGQRDNIISLGEECRSTKSIRTRECTTKKSRPHRDDSVLAMPLEDHTLLMPLMDPPLSSAPAARDGEREL